LYAGETTQIFPILYGLWAFYIVRGEPETALQLAQEFLDLAERQHDPAIIVAHHCVGWRFCMGELVAARPHFEQIAALYNVEQHHPLTFQYAQDPGPAGLSAGMLDLWLLGYPEQAQQWGERAMMLAREGAYSYTIGSALGAACWFHHFCQSWTVAQARAEELMALSTKLGLALWLAWGTITRGWALAKQGQGEAGIAQIREGVAAAQATGAAFFQTHHLAQLAEAYLIMGQPEAGLAVLVEALAQVETTKERFWEAEIYRLKGELLLTVAGPDLSHSAEKLPHAESPEACFLKAIEIARQQAGKSLELRATVSLGRLWQRQGKKDQAQSMLADIYGWFTEGFDTIDFQQAKALLDELSATAL
jgi:predicted ATPase